MINYIIVHNETIYEYLFKVFYRRTNKKEYDSHILQHHACYTHIFCMNVVIITAKRVKKSQNRPFLSGLNKESTLPVEVSRACVEMDLFS